MKKFSKILSVLLCVAMLLGLAAVVGAEEATSATISFSSKDNRTVFTTEQQVWVQNGITVTNDKASSASSVADYANPARFYAGSMLTIAYPSMTSMVVTCSETKHATALKNSISGATATAEGAVVTVEFDAAVDSFVIASLSAQVRVSSITVYGESTQGGGEEEVDTTTAGLVTDLSKLADGDKIVIVANEDAKALSTTQDKNNRRVAEVVKSEDLKTVTLTEAVQVITLEKDSETDLFAFKVGEDQYLYAASSSSNWLRTASKEDAGANGTWSISIRADGVATIKAQGENTRNWMRHNGNIIACYAAGQKDVAIYKVGYAGDLPAEVKATPATVAEAKAAANDAYLEVKGVVTNVYYNSIYIQDSTGAIKVTLSANASCEMGDTVIVTATKSGEILDGGKYVLSEGMTLTATETTLDKLSTLDIGLYVELKDVTVSEVVFDDDSNVIGFTLSDGTNSITASKTGIISISGTLAKDCKLSSIKFTLGISKDELVIWNATATVAASNPGDGEDKPGEGEDKPGDGEDKPGEGEDKPGEGEDKPGESVDITKPVENPAVDTGYKLGLNQENLGKYLYFAGDMNGYYLSTTESFDDAATVYLETVDGGYRLYFKDGEKKVYIDVQPSEDGQHINAVLTETPTCVYTWDSENLTLLTELDGETYYLGTYKNYSTIGPSKVTYISTSFPVHLYTDAPSQTGDVNLSVVVALMAVSALSVTALVAKKKEF